MVRLMDAWLCHMVCYDCDRRTLSVCSSLCIDESEQAGKQSRHWVDETPVFHWLVSDMVAVLCNLTRMVHCLCIITAAKRQSTWIYLASSRRYPMVARFCYPLVLVACFSSAAFEVVSTIEQVMEEPAIVVQIT